MTMEGARLIALQLGNGDPLKAAQILRTPSDLVLDAIEFNGFKSDYESAYLELNRENK